MNNKRKPRTLLHLGQNHCRWPLWDDHLTPLQEKLFCSEPAPASTMASRTAQPTRRRRGRLSTSAVEFFLPTLPPSKNKLREIGRNKKTGQHRIIRTSEYDAWRMSAGKEIMVQRVRKIKGPYNIFILARKPDDLRKRDLGNMLEATEDLLTWMQIIEDDHLSEDIHLKWITEIDSGVIIRVEAATD